MDLSKKVGLLKARAKDAAVDGDSAAQAALLEAAIDLIGELTEQLVALTEDYKDLDEEVQEIEEELDDLNALLLDEDFDDEEEDGFDPDGLFKVVCPNCGAAIQIDDEALENGSLLCPGCKETLEFEFGCGCGDESCSDCDLCGDEE
jgi:hypothetical protein